MQLASLDDLDTFPKLLLHNAANWPNEIALREKQFGIWRTITWRQYLDEVKRLAVAMHGLGVRRGDVVAIIGRNRPNWVFAEIAAHAIGCMTIGIYEDVLASEAGYLLSYSAARLVVAEDEEQVDKLLDLDEPARSIDRIIYHDARGMRKYNDPRLVGWTELDQINARELERDPGLFEDQVALGDGCDVAILCATSGTTSSPKLAMLQFKPFLQHVAAYLQLDPREPTDEYVCMLPLPWIMEQVYVLCMPLLCRIRVNFPESAETAMHDMREIGPTHLLLAPRVWEQTAADLRARMMDANKFNQWIFNFAVDRGLKAVNNGRHSIMANLLLFGAVRDRLGFSRVKSAATGGAALGPDTFRFFLAMGVPLRQLYGQTELSGAYTLQDGGEIDFDTSGIAFPDTEIRIEDQDENGIGEIVTRHSGMFKGYYKNREATLETLTGDGWMRTGDAGMIDNKGRLTVIDRVDDIASTSQGGKFSPQFIENKLKFSPYIGECVILGNTRPYLTAIICIRYSMVAKWAENRSIGFTNYQNLSANKDVCALIEGEVKTVNASLINSQRIKKFLLLYKGFDPDDGELTRTRKVRRKVIDERYQDIISALYGDGASVHVETEITFEDGRKGQIATDLEIRTMGAQETAAEPTESAA